MFKSEHVALEMYFAENNIDMTEMELARCKNCEGDYCLWEISSWSSEEDKESTPAPTNLAPFKRESVMKATNRYTPPVDMEETTNQEQTPLHPGVFLKLPTTERQQALNHGIPTLLPLNTPLNTKFCVKCNLHFYFCEQSINYHPHRDVFLKCLETFKDT